MSSERAGERFPGSVPAGRRIRLRAGRSTRDTAPAADRRRREPRPAPVQRAAATVGGVFGLIGLLGFLPGITSDIGALEFAGHHSAAMLFGVFTVSVVHNAMHLLFAVAGFVYSSTAPMARWYLFGGGATYLVLAAYGLLAGGGVVDVVGFNTADNWLHVVLGAGMAGLGFLPARTPEPEGAH